MTPKSDKLKSNDLKNTKQRTAILNILEKNNQPVSAEDIYSSLKSQKLSVSLSTVYRTLETMAEKKLVTKLNMQDNSKALFEINHEIHKHYLICIGCKKIISIMSCPLENYEEKLGKETGFLIEGHRLDIYGYCPECRKNMSSESSGVI